MYEITQLLEIWSLQSAGVVQVFVDEMTVSVQSTLVMSRTSCGHNSTHCNYIHVETHLEGKKSHFRVQTQV